MNLSDLLNQFPDSDVEWRVQSQGLTKENNKPFAKVVPYITVRGIQSRLDEVCGPQNWRNEYLFPASGGILCGISILIDGQWITKWDGAELGDDAADDDIPRKKGHIDSVKQGCSNSMKRAAVQWGIGRYLYAINEGWAIFCENGEYTTKINDQHYNWNPPSMNGTKKNMNPPKSQAPATPQPSPSPSPSPQSQSQSQYPGKKNDDSGEAATDAQKKAIRAISHSKNITDKRVLWLIGEEIGRAVTSIDAITKSEASSVIKMLDKVTPEI